MFRFENPLDPSKDGGNMFMDGIRFHIRNSTAIVEELEPHILYYTATAQYGDSSLDILERMLYNHRYSIDELTVADEHYLLDKISANLND